MPVAITTFRNVRARLIRQPNGKPLAGWVTHLAREEARIRLWTYTPMTSGERVTCECYGQGTVARFSGAVVAQAGQDLAIDLLGSISYAPSEETPRIYATGLNGQLRDDETTALLTVLDISPVSLGGIVDVQFESTGALTMELETEMGPISAQVTIANSRPDPDSPGLHRLGLHVVDMARLDRARWGRLVAEKAEA